LLLLLFLREKFISELSLKWVQFDQSIVDAAISQGPRRLSACVCVRGTDFEHKF